MIFPVVLSFDKEIAFGNRMHIKRRRGTMAAGKSQFFHSSDTRRQLYTIFVSFTFMVHAATVVLSHRDP